MKEYKINDYLSLELEGEKTNIYVAGKLFRQCKHLLLTIPIQSPDYLMNFDSIDEAAEFFEVSGEIPPETEFWGHCSNLQAWFENNYDTRLLHYSLSFPLLEKLSKIGDPLAKRVFKEDIARRFSSGHNTTMEYIACEGYLRYLREEEFDDIFYHFKNKDIKTIKFTSEYLERLPKSISSLKKLEKLHIENGNLTSLPDSIGELKSLKTLIIFNNKLKTLPDSIGNLKSLETLLLGNNLLSKIPETLGNLKSIKQLSLWFNNITEIPESLGNLESLEFLELHDNPLKKFPESLINLHSLSRLKLNKYQFKLLPKLVKKFLRNRNIETKRDIIIIERPWFEDEFLFEQRSIKEELDVPKETVNDDIEPHVFIRLTREEQKKYIKELEERDEKSKTMLKRRMKEVGKKFLGELSK